MFGRRESWGFNLAICNDNQNMILASTLLHNVHCSLNHRSIRSWSLTQLHICFYEAVILRIRIIKIFYHHQVMSKEKAEHRWLTTRLLIGIDTFSWQIRIVYMLTSFFKPNMVFMKSWKKNANLQVASLEQCFYSRPKLLQNHGTGYDHHEN